MEQKEIARIALRTLVNHARALNGYKDRHEDRYATDELLGMAAVAQFLARLNIRVDWNSHDFPKPFRILDITVWTEEEEFWEAIK